MIVLKEKPKVGFIGIGVMGRSMASLLLQAGYELVIYNRTKQKAEALIEKGAIWCDTVCDVAKQADVIITIIGYPKDVEEVYLGEDGLLACAKKGAYCIDMTTSSPLLAETIYEQGKEKGIHILDAPVSGGDIGAKNGTLSIMVGGDKEDFEAVFPLFQVMGENIIYHGKAGNGQHTKMCNQISFAAGMISVAESMAYAKKAGLDQHKVLESITKGAAASWTLSNLAPRMIEGDFEPGFYIKHFLKDIRIALEVAETMNLEMPGLTLVKSMYEKLVEQGEENSGTQAIYKLIV
ncbi:MAG TPA: NAD(P)-dependent oxidoreductase [Massilibacterium sp.]|nr:NAD(P)-dependent oxidoreductase [Massilibacterium sp.]